MDLQLAGKTALVTGASQGIGSSIARVLATEGVRICIAARRTNLLEQLADDIAVSGASRPHIVGVDIMEDGAPQRLARAACAALGHVDILMNSAGGSRPAIAIDAPEE